MKNPLIKSALIVFFFWYAVLYLMSDAPMIDMPATLLSTILWVALASSIGVSIVLAKGLFYRGERDQRLMGRKLRGASTTLGHPPIPGLAPRHPAGNSLEDHWKEFGWTPRGEVPPEFWAQIPWWDAYCKKHPSHAAAFVGCAQVMFGMRSLPASPIPGGHGGVSLIRHSISVLNTMMQMAPDWKFTGHRNKKGQLTADGALYDLTKTHHAFDFRSLADADFDPILPLVAFAHDIGKVRCYEPVNWKKEPRSFFRRKKPQTGWDGPVDIVREVKPLHGREGARLLRRMAEIHNLPMRDRDALTISVGYYHEISEMPKARWIDDRVRSLTHLLYEADVATGVQEGDLDALSHNVDVGLAMTPEPSAQETQDPLSPARKEAKSATQNTGSPSGRIDPAFPPLPVDEEGGGAQPLNPERPGSESDESSALAMVRNLLSKPGTVNHPRAKGAAYKFGDWVFMQELTLRQHLAELYEKGDLARPGSINKTDPFTLKLLAELHENGWMFNFFDGYEYSAVRALWDVEVKKSDGKPLRERFVVVASIKAFPELAALSDATPRHVICCSYGANAAINKKLGPIDSPQDTPPPSPAMPEDALHDEAARHEVGVVDSPEAPVEETGQPSRHSLMDDALDAAMGLEPATLEPMRFETLKALARRRDIPFLEVDGRRLYKESIIREYLDTRKEVRGPNSGVKGTRVNDEVFFYLDPDHKGDA